VDTSLDSYRSIIEQVLNEYSKYPYAYGQIERRSSSTGRATITS